MVHEDLMMIPYKGYCRTTLLPSNPLQGIITKQILILHSIDGHSSRASHKKVGFFKKIDCRRSILKKK